MEQVIVCSVWVVNSFNPRTCTRENSKVHSCQKVHGRRVCTEPMEVVHIKQKANRGPRLEVFTHTGGTHILVIELWGQHTSHVVDMVGTKDVKCGHGDIPTTWS